MTLPQIYVRNLLRIIGLALAALALSVLGGCSAIRLAYNNAPELGYWWLDGYADFDESQAPQVRDGLYRLQQWHRRTELPRIANLLQRVQRMAAADIDGAQACAVFGEARARFLALTEQAEPAVLALAQSLGPEQLLHIERKFAKTNAEWRADMLEGSPTERAEKRLQANLERSEQFYGKLLEPQLAVLRAALESSNFDPQTSYAERLRRQQDLLQTLRSLNREGTGKADIATARVALRGYLDRALESPNPQYRAYSEKLIAGSCQRMALLHNSTSAEQRDRAVRRLAAYERDARELSGQR